MRQAIIGSSIALALGLIGYASLTLLGDIGKPDLPLVYYTVRRGNLDITVVERGNLESQDNVSILCEVDDIRGDGIDGTPIIWIVENGASVKKGDLLVEFDSASHLERLDQKILEVEQAIAEEIKTRALYEDQISQNEKALKDAKLKVELAKLDLEMFADKTNGTHQLEVEEIERTLDEVNNEILAAQASLELKRNDRDGIESLFKLGYAGKSELERARLDFLQAESELASKLNRLKTHLATLEKKKTYERRKQQMTLAGELDTAERVLIQVTNNNKAELDQAKAAMDAAKRALEKEQELLERYKLHLSRTKIYAPQDGMVAYATGRRYRGDQTIGQGTAVYERQEIMTLPNLSMMQVKTAVHESVLDQINVGLPATVKIDAFPDRQYRGSVKSVAVLPDQGGWMSSDTKVYETVVTIDEEVHQLKPGMTAVVEIHVDHLSDVVSIPVQAVVQVKRDNWCYVERDGKIEKVAVEVGASNTKFVEIKSGLVPGDQLVLNPMAIVEHQGTQQSMGTDRSQSEETATNEPSSAEATPQSTVPAAESDTPQSGQ
jgi:RND family efflux transporter MFP subunit